MIYSIVIFFLILISILVMYLFKRKKRYPQDQSLWTAINENKKKLGFNWIVPLKREIAGKDDYLDAILYVELFDSKKSKQSHVVTIPLSKKAIRNIVGYMSFNEIIIRHNIITAKLNKVFHNNSLGIKSIAIKINEKYAKKPKNIIFFIDKQKKAAIYEINGSKQIKILNSNNELQEITIPDSASFEKKAMGLISKNMMYSLTHKKPKKIVFPIEILEIVNQIYQHLESTKLISNSDNEKSDKKQ